MLFFDTLEKDDKFLDDKVRDLYLFDFYLMAGSNNIARSLAGRQWTSSALAEVRLVPEKLIIDN